MVHKKKKKGAKQGGKRRAKKGAKRGVRKGVSKRGKVAKGAKSSTIAAAINRIESRVDRLEVNDAANVKMWLGLVNAGRKSSGRPQVKSLPGFVTPRLFRGGYGVSKKQLGAGG